MKPPDPISKSNSQPDFPELPKGPTNQQGNLSTFVPTNFMRYLEVDFQQTNRRHVNPYQVISDIEKITGEKTCELTGGSKSKFILNLFRLFYSPV